MVFYLFGIAAVVLFKRNDPFHFPNLHFAMLSLSRAATSEDWTDIADLDINIIDINHSRSRVSDL